jgi:Tfp pilus assembly protein PilX
MKTQFTNQQPAQAGSALLITLIMGAIALTILGSVMAWSATSSRLTHRSIQYTRSVAAAEAATEKVAGQIIRDFLYNGENRVVANLDFYRQNTVPTAADSAYWNNWVFNDANGNNGRTYVERAPGTSYVVLGSSYAGLKGYVSTYTVVAHARDTASSQDVTGGVFQELQLAGIPIFQFALYSAGNMEVSCGQPFSVTGRVHANKHLYVEPDNALTFKSSVTAVVDILFQRDPLDPRGLVPNGSVVYEHPDEKESPVAALTLPIGTTNTPEGVREIIQPPPSGEDPTSPLGRLRYYNQCDMVLVVSNSGVSATSGAINNFATIISSNDLAVFASTNSSFYDAREGKTVLPLDINVGNLKAWSETNTSLRTSVVGTNLILNSLYVLDKRTLPASSLAAVRVRNGKQLPVTGLTVATARPLYVLGDYNQQNDANLGTSNTATTRPASLVGDAITILSVAWTDANSTSSVGSRGAASTTVNAAFLTGVVETTTAHYSGGMENFPRFLETWGLANIFTYNGSMVKMFPSLYATNAWNNNNNIYAPPKRNWAYDVNFEDPTKLPPKTPQVLKVFRSRWATAAPGQNVATTYR